MDFIFFAALFGNHFCRDQNRGSCVHDSIPFRSHFLPLWLRNFKGNDLSFIHPAGYGPRPQSDLCDFNDSFAAFCI